jgi:predicted ester cyclase
MGPTEPATGNKRAAVSQPVADTMSRSEIEEFFTRRQAAWDRLDAAALAADYSEDCVVDTPSAGLPLKGRLANEQLFRKIFEAFPDLRRRLDALLIDGDLVAEFGTSTGTDIGGFMELQPTGKAFRIPNVCLYTLKDRQIFRERRIYDFTGLLVQVGVLKVKPI